MPVTPNLTRMLLCYWMSACRNVEDTRRYLGLALDAYNAQRAIDPDTDITLATAIRGVLEDLDNDQENGLDSMLTVVEDEPQDGMSDISNHPQRPTVAVYSTNSSIHSLIPLTFYSSITFGTSIITSVIYNRGCCFSPVAQTARLLSDDTAW